jgi:5S rRNA maturation endonuclease (ribonuclease M5)
MPGTRLGLLFYGWNQSKFMAQVKGIIVTEGAFNALAIQQSLNMAYGGISHNPWRVISCSGSGAGTLQKETLRELKEQGYKVIVAPDTDEAGINMCKKFTEAGSITHYAFTSDTSKDWNNILQDLGHKEFARFFLSTVKVIDVDQE